jgi:hypothetical protein
MNLLNIRPHRPDSTPPIPELIPRIQVMSNRIGLALAILMVLTSPRIASSGEPPQVTNGRPLDEARRQAEVLHTALHAALQVVHHRYYREDEGLPIPAATLKDVFAELEEEHRLKLRWLAVEGQAMNTDHKPRDAFEREAVEALKSGSRQFERAENGVYRRAGSITLGNHCLKCHVPNRKSTEDRTAGLIIAIPIE